MTNNEIKALELRIARNKKTSSHITSDQVQKDAIEFNKTWSESIVVRNNA
jgi:hypothetical protein